MSHHNPAAFAPGDESPALWLEICRGRTQFPRRPVLTSRFLIGAGSNCHLQLGGDGVPFLHSIIDQSNGVVSIEAFTAQPELRINGQIVRSAVLADGDELSIGGFTFRLHGVPAMVPEAIDPLLADVPLDLADPDDEAPAELSAAELVARLEAADEEVTDFEEAEQSGLQALLGAVRHWRPEPSRAEDVAMAPAAAAAASEAALTEELATISLEVEQRLAQLRQWEAEQTARAETLLSAQDRLAEQLRLAAQSLATEQARVRASA